MKAFGEYWWCHCNLNKNIWYHSLLESLLLLFLHYFQSHIGTLQPCQQVLGLFSEPYCFRETVKTLQEKKYNLQWHLDSNKCQINMMEQQEYIQKSENHMNLSSLKNKLYPENMWKFYHFSSNESQQGDFPLVKTLRCMSSGQTFQNTR